MYKSGSIDLSISEVFVVIICWLILFIHAQEKEKALISDDYGKDLASVQALQRKHEGFVVSDVHLYQYWFVVICIHNNT